MGEVRLRVALAVKQSQKHQHNKSNREGEGEGGGGGGGLLGMVHFTFVNVQTLLLCRSPYILCFS